MRQGATRAPVLGVMVVMVALGGCSDDEPDSAAETSDGGTAEGSTGTAQTSAMTETGASTTEAPSACGASPEAFADCVDPAAYQDDLEFIAAVRTPGSGHWQEVQDLCADRLTSLGYDVDLFEYATGVDVLGTLPGSDPNAPRVMIGAHYDHIDGCAGADDNATGVAGILEAARVLAEGSFPRSLTIACWDEEERGLIGSTAFAAAAKQQAIPIAAYYNFEMIGFATDEPDTQGIPQGFDIVFPQEIQDIEANQYRGDFIFVVGDQMSEASVASLVRHGQRVGLPVVAVTLTPQQQGSLLFAQLRRSDHAPFWDHGFPGIFITDTAEFRNARYHCTEGEDTVDSLDAEFAVGVVKATVGSAAEALAVVP